MGWQPNLFPSVFQCTRILYTRFQLIFRRWNQGALSMTIMRLSSDKPNKFKAHGLLVFRSYKYSCTDICLRSVMISMLEVYCGVFWKWQTQTVYKYMCLCLGWYWVLFCWIFQYWNRILWNILIIIQDIVTLTLE